MRPETRQPSLAVQREARQRFAAAVREQGPAWKNTADSIIAGFSNIWIAPALAALALTIEEGDLVADD